MKNEARIDVKTGDTIRSRMGFPHTVKAVCGRLFAINHLGTIRWYDMDDWPVGFKLPKPPESPDEPESPDDVVHRFRDSGNYLLEVSRDGRFRTVHGSWVECYWAPEVARLALMKEKA